MSEDIREILESAEKRVLRDMQAEKNYEFRKRLCDKLGIEDAHFESVPDPIPITVIAELVFPESERNRRKLLFALHEYFTRHNTPAFWKKDKKGSKQSAAPSVIGWPKPASSGFLSEDGRWLYRHTGGDILKHGKAAGCRRPTTAVGTG